MTTRTRLTTNAQLVKEPGTEKAVERIRMVRHALQEGASYRETLDEIAKAEGAPLRSDTFRMFLLEYFGTSRWPYKMDRALSENSKKRLRDLKKWSKEGIDKREAMKRLGVGEVAFNRFLHRHYGSCIWPLGEGVDGRRKDTLPPLPITPTEITVSTTLTDRMALDYINHRTQHDGEQLAKVLEELPWVRHVWGLLCGFVVMRAPNE